MATQLLTAGSTRKTHKSRKTTPEPASEPGPSSVALATVPPIPPDNPTAAIIAAEAPSLDKALDIATDVPTVDPKKQWWHRPSDSKARKKAEKIAVMRAAGHKSDVIAKRLHTTEGTVRQIMFIARKNGWLDDNDEPVDLEAELAFEVDRKIVRNVSASLDGQMTNWQTHEMTIAAAKGRGVFKTHEVNKNEGVQSMPLVAIQVVMPPVGAGDQLPDIKEDQMGGVPAYFSEGDIVE